VSVFAESNLHRGRAHQVNSGGIDDFNSGNLGDVSDLSTDVSERK
jgi:hypothetical protein